MTTNTECITLQSTVTELFELLQTERQALRQLDIKRLDQVTERKTVLEEQLRRLGPQGPLTSELRAQLQELRETAKNNQILLVHARNCVRVALAAASGQPLEVYHPDGTTPSPAASVRVNVKG